MTPSHPSRSASGNNRSLTRREFISQAGRLAAALGGAGLVLGSPLRLIEMLSRAEAAGVPLSHLLNDAPVARYWLAAEAAGADCSSCHSQDEGVDVERHKHAGRPVKCLLCAQGCLIKQGERGRCRTRVNIEGQLRTLSYGRPVSVHVDPIEKKPFYHYRPGSEAFSMATAGCPLHCRFCQNWELSQARPEDFDVRFVPPETVVQAAGQRQAPIIAYTYNEPTVFTEYMTDIARLSRRQGFDNVLISCGFMNREPLSEMCSVLDGIKIDLKGFSPDFYRRVCGAELDPVLRSIKQVADSATHLEIVNLVVPTLNDSEEMLTGLVEWVMGEIGPDVPIHFTRFHPDYQLQNLPPTPVSTLERAYDIAKSHGIHYPYVGNVPGHPGNNTYCPGCGRAVISRTGFFVTGNHVTTEGACEYCNQAIAGVWAAAN